MYVPHPLFPFFSCRLSPSPNPLFPFYSCRLSPPPPPPQASACHSHIKNLILTYLIGKLSLQLSEVLSHTFCSLIKIFIPFFLLFVKEEPITSLFLLRFTAILYGIFYYYYYFFLFIFQICFRKTASIYFGILLQTSILNKSDHCRCPLPTPGGIIMLLYKCLLSYS